jgi:hypothetical protein
VIGNGQWGGLFRDWVFKRNSVLNSTQRGDLFTAAKVDKWTKTTAPGFLPGFHGNMSYSTSPSDHTLSAQKAATIGVKVLRSALLWSRIQAGGSTSFDWTALDTYVNALVTNGITPHLYMYDSPQWANGSTDRFDIPGAGSSTAPAFLTWISNMKTFITAVVNRYKDRVKMWEAWNEPNLTVFWETKSPTQYGVFYKEFRASVLAADPTAKVSFGSVTGYEANGEMVGRDFMSQARTAAGAGIVIDRLGLHPYESPLGSDPLTYTAFSDNADAIRMALDEYEQLGHRGVKLWLTEFGDYGAASRAAQSANLLTYFETIRDYYGGRVEAAEWFMLRDESPTYPTAGVYSNDFSTAYTAATTFQTFMTAWNAS